MNANNQKGPKPRFTRQKLAHPKRDDFCFYHRTYGSDAVKCKDETERGVPCQYKKTFGNNGKSDPNGGKDNEAKKPNYNNNNNNNNRNNYGSRSATSTDGNNASNSAERSSLMPSTSSQGLN